MTRRDEITVRLRELKAQAAHIRTEAAALRAEAKALDREGSVRHRAESAEAKRARDQTAVQMRAAGATYAAIGKAIGLTRGHVRMMLLKIERRKNRGEP